MTQVTQQPHLFVMCLVFLRYFLFSLHQYIFMLVKAAIESCWWKYIDNILRALHQQLNPYNRRLLCKLKHFARLCGFYLNAVFISKSNLKTKCCSMKHTFALMVSVCHSSATSLWKLLKAFFCWEEVLVWPLRFPKQPSK